MNQHIISTSSAWIVAVAVFLTASPVSAAIETITVTASRTPIDLLDAGSATTIIDRAAIEQSNAISIADLLRSVPGLQVNQQGSRGAITQVRSRGAEANQILVIIDGIEANDPAQGSEFNFAHLMASQVERVEIVRGPQSALWGSDALAGVVNIITTSSGTATPRFDIVAEAGSFGSHKAGFSFRNNDTRSQLGISLHQFKTDGTNISRAGGEEDGYENTTIGLNGSFALTDRLVLEGLFKQVKSETDFDAIDFFSTGLPVDADNLTKSEQRYGKLSLATTSPGGQVGHKITIAQTDTDNENDNGSPINDITRGTKNKIQYQGDINLVNHVVSFIGEYEDVDYEQRGLATPFGDPNKDLNTTNKGLAFEYRYQHDNWNFSVSARHDNNSDYDDASTFRITGVWHTPYDGLHLFTSLGQASKNPTFTERFGFFDTFNGNPDLKPETAESFEAGLRYSTMNGSVTSSLSYFNTDLKDEINGFVFDSSTFTFTAENRDGDSNRQGVEFEFDWHTTENFTMRGSYTYIDSTFTDLTRDLDEIRRPRHVAALIGNYQRSKVNLNLSINYNGDQLDDFFPPFPRLPERVMLGSYTLVNLSGSYQISENVRLTARLENTLDESYEEVYGFSSPGFSAYGGVSLSW